MKPGLDDDDGAAWCIRSQFPKQLAQTGDAIMRFTTAGKCQVGVYRHAHRHQALDPVPIGRSGMRGVKKNHRVWGALTGFRIFGGSLGHQSYSGNLVAINGQMGREYGNSTG